MNTLKITKINDMLTEQHNLECAKIVQAKVHGRKYDFYTPCNLNIYIGPNCNCNCDFCFAAKFNAGPDMSDKEYLFTLEEALCMINEVPIEVTITGGEPTLYPERLIKVMELMKKHGIKQRTFSTNGICLEEQVDGKPLLQHMKENEFIHNINLSRMSIDEENNQKIFNGTCLTNKRIGKIATYAELNGMEMRLSCNLIENEVDSWEAICEYMNFYRGNQIDSFIFRELTGCQNPVLMETIAEEMLNDKDICHLKTMENIFYQVDIYQLKDMLIKHYKQKHLSHASIANLVFYNGKLLSGWNGNVL